MISVIFSSLFVFSFTSTKSETGLSIQEAFELMVLSYKGEIEGILEKKDLVVQTLKDKKPATELQKSQVVLLLNFCKVGIWLGEIGGLGSNQL